MSICGKKEGLGLRLKCNNQEVYKSKRGDETITARRHNNQESHNHNRIKQPEGRAIVAGEGSTASGPPAPLPHLAHRNSDKDKY